MADPNVYEDATFILKFLRTCKFDLEKTKKRITKYYSIRYSTPEWFARTEENMIVVDHLLDRRIAMFMDFANGCEDAILIVKPGAFEHKQYDIKYIGACAVLVFEALLADVRVQIAGVQYVIDCSNVGLGMAMQITPSILYKFINCWQNIMPMRLKGIHILNANPIVNKLLSIAKYFLSKKLRERFYIHDADRISFYEHFSTEWVPTEYGGSAGDEIEFVNNLHERFTTKKRFLLNDEKYGLYKFPES